MSSMDHYQSSVPGSRDAPLNDPAKLLSDQLEQSPATPLLFELCALLSQHANGFQRRASWQSTPDYRGTIVGRGRDARYSGDGASFIHNGFQPGSPSYHRETVTSSPMFGSVPQKPPSPQQLYNLGVVLRALESQSSVRKDSPQASNVAPQNVPYNSAPNGIGATTQILPPHERQSWHAPTHGFSSPQHAADFPDQSSPVSRFLLNRNRRSGSFASMPSYSSLSLNGSVYSASPTHAMPAQNGLNYTTIPQPTSMSNPSSIQQTLNMAGTSAPGGDSTSVNGVNGHNGLQQQSSHPRALMAQVQNRTEGTALNADTLGQLDGYHHRRQSFGTRSRAGSERSGLMRAEISPPINPELTSDANPFALKPEFKLRHKKFFRIGRVFIILWAEPEHVDDAKSAVRSVNSLDGWYGERVHSKPRRFVVVRQFERHCIAIPIDSHRQRGVGTQRGAKFHNGIIHTTSQPPDPLDDELPGPGEQPMQPVAIRVHPDNPTIRLNPASRINYAKAYTVEYNIKVSSVGSVHDKSLAPLLNQFRDVFNEQLEHHELSVAVNNMRLANGPSENMPPNMDTGVVKNDRPKMVGVEGNGIIGEISTRTTEPS